MPRKLPPIHPGQVLKEDFMAPLDLSATKLGHILGVPPNRITEIVRGRRGISGDTALRLARYFGVSARFWLNLQNRYDLDIAEDAAGGEIKHIPRYAA
ncbi:MAG: HigA family addiction module antidote protein [Proteobacteria bacterium]|nr:HigA family addiction module antidote protein [Pseudomonadota bacterium]